VHIVDVSKHVCIDRPLSQFTYRASGLTLVAPGRRKGHADRVLGQLVLHALGQQMARRRRDKVIANAAAAAATCITAKQATGLAAAQHGRKAAAQHSIQ